MLQQNYSSFLDVKEKLVYYCENYNHLFETILHQTLEDRNNVDEVESHGPYPVKNVETSYLGAGYYFWDDHIELAKWWGDCHCEGNYMICEARLKVDSEIFLDLVGNRKNQQFMAAALEKFNISDFSLAKAIEFLKDLNKKPNSKGVFPYKVIRAIDTRKNSSFHAKRPKKIKFSSAKAGETSLAPMILICMVEKNKLLLTGYKVIYPEDYAVDY